MPEEKLTRNEQREQARAKAKALREQQVKKDKRNRLTIQISVVVVVLAIIGIVAGFIINASQSSSSRPDVGETPANLSFNEGIKIGVGLQAFTATNEPVLEGKTDIPNIQVWVDYQCPVCQAFDVPNSSQIRSWVDTGVATVEIHPISFLDRASVDEYSSRAANLAACTANYAPDNFYDVHTILMERQPGEGTATLTNDDLLDVASDAGVNIEGDFTSCVESKAFADWIALTTDEVLSNPRPDSNVQISGTPSIIVNGQPYTWTTGEEIVSPERFAQFVQTAMAR